MKAKSRVTQRASRLGPAVGFTVLLFFSGAMIMGCEPAEAPPEEDAEEQTVEPEEENGASEPEEAESGEDVETGDEAEAIDAEERITLVDMDALTEVVEEGQGTVTVVNFWATWCPPCLNEMPHLVEFYETHGGDGVTFISVTADAPRTIDSAVAPYMTREDIPFHVYVMDGIQPPDVAEGLDIDFRGALPVTVIFDQEGDVAAHWEEEITLADLEEAVDPLLDTT
ncbi:MAG: TlpA disulfide reductase family protein [Candidatus Hydrogenedentota bacterium]